MNEEIAIIYLKKYRSHFLVGAEINQEKTKKFLKNIDLDGEGRRRIKAELFFAPFEYEKEEVDKELKKYEKIDCKEFRESIVL